MTTAKTPERWMLLEDDLARVLAEWTLPLDPTSGLAALARDDEKVQRGQLSDLDEALTNAIARVAAPKTEVRIDVIHGAGRVVLTMVPGGPGDDIVTHVARQDATHAFVLISEDEAIVPLVRYLSLELATPPPRVELTGGGAVLATFLGTVDWWREGALRSLLSRRPLRPSTFGVGDLQEVLSRCREAGDARWLSYAIARSLPGDGIFDADLQAGLDLMTARELLLGHGAEYTLTPQFELVCSAMAAAPASASVRFRSQRNGAWRRGQFVVVRGAGCLWSIEVRPDGQYRLREVSAADVDLMLSGALAGTLEFADEAGPEPGHAAMCVHCGHRISLPSRFCGQCGKPTSC